MVREEKTVEELGRLTVFAEKLRIVADSCHRSIYKKVLWLVQRAARKRAESSNIGDNNLATFVIYADFSEADSRTMEYLNRQRSISWNLKTILTPKRWLVERTYSWLSRGQ